MKTLHALYHLIRADFLERVRGYGFLVTIGLAILMGYNVFIGRFGITLGGYEGVANAAWFGTVTTVTMTPYLMLLGFYLVRGTINRDRKTGVGQIIATTPIGKGFYTAGKFVSNFLTLAAMIGVLILSAAVMLLVHGQGKALDLWVLISPFIFITLPIAMLTAGIAILFDSIPRLSKGFGNILYIFGYYAMIMGSFTFLKVARQMMGFNIIDEQIVPALAALDPSYGGGWALGVIPPGQQIFLWEGYSWTSEVVLGRVIWIGVSILIALIAAIPFDRFDPAKQKLEREKSGRLQRLGDWFSAFKQRNLLRRKALSPEVKPEITELKLEPTNVSISPSHFWDVLLAELKLMFSGHRFFWYLGAMGLNIACLISPTPAVRQVLIPLVWLWPVLIWSQLGTRERQHNMGQIVFSTPRQMAHQFPGLFLAAISFTAINTSGVALHLALNGEAVGLFTWGGGVMFVSALAVTLGVLSKTSRLFEMVYSLIWYFGLIERVPAFDFVGATGAGLMKETPTIFWGITVGLVVLAGIWRWREQQTYW